MMKTLFCFLVCIFISVGFAQFCINEEEVQATGFGISGSDTDTQFRQALSEALAGAITQTSGLYINRKTELTEIVSSVTLNGETSFTEISDLSKKIIERFSGTILNYDILNNVTNSDGIQQVDILAKLCLDQKILLNLIGTQEDVNTFSGQLRTSVEKAGWQITGLVAENNIRESREVLERALESGATLILDGQIKTGKAEDVQDTTGVFATINATIYSTKSLEIVDSISENVNGKGYTLDTSRQDALSKLSGIVGNQLSIKFLDASDRQKGIIIIKNITRSGNRYTLSDLAATIPGVIAINDAIYERGHFRLSS